MPLQRLTLIMTLCAGCGVWAQDEPAAAAAAVPLAEDSTITDDGVRVAVLGYHELCEKLPETAMRIHTSKFRRQMATIRQLGITVIALDDFMAWKMGAKKIPEKSALITFDDGWKSVYTEALPILREFGYPFSIYLYKQYVDGGGKALTTAMIQEMVTGGTAVGSHSVSHPYPGTIKKYCKQGVAAYDAFLRVEMGESKRFLEYKFGLKVTSYAYPGGYHTEEMFPLAKEFGYTHAFTVVPGKVQRSTADLTLPRYMIFGNNDKVFEMATTYHESPSPGTTPAGTLAGIAPTTPYPVVPEPGAIINSRLPTISANLRNVDSLNPASLVMQVSGFGEVPAIYDAASGKLSWQVNRPLRQPTCQVAIHWKNTAGKAPETPLRWSFQIDRESAYLPDGQ